MDIVAKPTIRDCWFGFRTRQMKEGILASKEVIPQSTRRMGFEK